MPRKKQDFQDFFKDREWTPSAEMSGIFLITFALFTLLSLISFKEGGLLDNWLGLTGYYTAHSALFLFGWNSYLVLLALIWLGWQKLFQRSPTHLAQKGIWFCIGVASLSILLCQMETVFPSLRDLFISTLAPLKKSATSWLPKQIDYHVGGSPFHYLYQKAPNYNLMRIVGQLGTFLIFGSTLLASLVALFQIEASSLLLALQEMTKSIFNRMQQILSPLSNWLNSRALSLKKKEKIREEIREAPALEERLSFKRSGKIEPLIMPMEDEAPSLNRPHPLLKEIEFSEEVYPPLSSRKRERFSLETPDYQEIREQEVKEPPETKKSSPQPLERARKDASPSYEDYALPDKNLLTTPKKIDQSLLKKDLMRQAEVLEETLLSFGIEAKVGQIHCGPRITSLEVHPAIGVKVQRIKALENDIALNMQAQSIRIIAPIPGKAAVGVEIPNPYAQEVSFKELLQEYQQSKQKLRIPLLLGKSVSGDHVVADLTKMPHCIIAGATGSGKSVCINTIVMSILMLASPDQIRLIMIDPKKVELTPYSKLPHMLAPVITEPSEAAAALNWLVKEMERRYELLKIIGVRNIDGFNARKIREDEGKDQTLEIPERLNYIVCIIDELADLMMVSTQDIETPIARIAQMARAVGIHMILATQRPSREVITGLIKANFPTRICFKVSSRVNSQIVLDEPGSESLLGNGDMLFLPPGTSHLTRAQGAYLRDEDIQAIVSQIEDQYPPNYAFSSFSNVLMDDLKSGAEDTSLDSLFEQAKQIVLSTGNASTTFLQRKLKIGYARAASLMDQLEDQNIVGKADGSKPRQILSRSAKMDEREKEELLEDSF
ncbi:MAG: ftsK [Chlamydiales bacterium]|jgi:S-DNA-T family DNA segregation ATPase FtsK/SpoIIIE|nr:ftsK [Chlamydiales bacterium]